MKKNFLQVLTFFILSSSLFAQAPNSKWITVLDSPDESIYIDTSNIRQYENQLSALTLTSYKTPQTFASITKPAIYVKTQLLFNIPLRKYSVIGTLYYDKELKILGETSLPGFSSNSENFGKPIDGNQVMTAIFTKAYELINKETPPPAEDRADKLEGLSNALSSSQAGQGTTGSLAKVNTDAAKQTQEIQQTKIPVDNSKAKVFTSPGLKDSSIRILSNPPNKTEPTKQLQSDKAAKSSGDKDYNTEAETNLKGTIFTDGSKYSFQVSSWKVKAKAESEVQRLKSEGHNAFITEGIVKGSTWYRVRIGYFNSLEETEAYMKKIK